MLEAPFEAHSCALATMVVSAGIDAWGTTARTSEGSRLFRKPAPSPGGCPQTIDLRDGSSVTRRRRRSHGEQDSSQFSRRAYDVDGGTRSVHGDRVEHRRSRAAAAGEQPPPEVCSSLDRRSGLSLTTTPHSSSRGRGSAVPVDDRCLGLATAMPPRPCSVLACCCFQIPPLRRWAPPQVQKSRFASAARRASQVARISERGAGPSLALLPQG